MRSGSFSRGRSENFLVEMEGGIGNKESWQDKIILKIEHLCLHTYIYAYMYVEVPQKQLKSLPKNYLFVRHQNVFFRYVCLVLRSVHFGYFGQADDLKSFPLLLSRKRNSYSLCFNRGFLEFFLTFALSASLRMSVTNTFFNLRSKIGRQKVRMLVQ